MITLICVALIFVLAVMVVFAIVGAIAISPVLLLVALFIAADYLIIKTVLKKKDK